MVANRAVAPSSKLNCYEQWLAEDVRIDGTSELSLHHLYRAMDFLEAHISLTVLALTLQRAAEIDCGGHLAQHSRRSQADQACPIVGPSRHRPPGNGSAKRLKKLGIEKPQEIFTC
ncbi:MAG: hypothetical protein ACC742_08430 [Thermoanaerobaculales bacterium]